MSSYRGAWDGGPPGAEADYAGQPPYVAPLPPGPARPGPVPTTDPWTGVSYTQYPQPTYDYQAYAAAAAAPSFGNINYDSSFYQRPDGTYYEKYTDSRSYLPQQASYDYQSRPQERTRSPVDSRIYDQRRPYRSNSRSASPYERKERAYSRKRDSSYEEGNRRHRSRSRSKAKKYSSSSSSRSRSYTPVKKKRSSISSESSYRRKSSKSRGSDRSLTPPLRKRSNSRSRKQHKSRRSPSLSRSVSKSPRDDGKKKACIPHSSKEKRGKDKRQRECTTPPRKQKEITQSKDYKKSKRSSITPPKSYKKHEHTKSPPRSYKYKDRKTDTPPKKRGESSVTPPKSYARSASSSSSPSPRQKRRQSHSSSRSHRSSTSPRRSRSISKRKSQKTISKHRSRSKSRSTSRHHSKSRGKGKQSVSPKPDKSRSHSSRSRSQSGSASEDERRGQFTVADRKRFWKLHKSRQEGRRKETRTPPKEVKPPPGAVESKHVEDIEYGVPPEVEGPNFAELLPTAEQVMQQASSSKSKAVPIPIKNDGSFLEMFKKLQEETKSAEVVKKPEIKKPTLPFIGKRRGGRVLKTGLVKKAKAIDEQTVDNAPKDAWSLYMQEVKKYRETSCEEERKTRPLVK